LDLKTAKDQLQVTTEKLNDALKWIPMPDRATIVNRGPAAPRGNFIMKNNTFVYPQNSIRTPRGMNVTVEDNIQAGNSNSIDTGAARDAKVKGNVQGLPGDIFHSLK
jgi:hypothetical protein